MKKRILLILLCLLCCSCRYWWVHERTHTPWGGIGFISPEHQSFDIGAFRSEGNTNIYQEGISFQFPSFGIYGGSDHTSLGILAGFTVYYGDDVNSE